MVKTLVVSSSTPAEDKMAAFMIEREAKADPTLQRAVWYSNLGNCMAEVKTKMALLEAQMADIAKAHVQLNALHLNLGDRLLKVEKAANIKTKESNA